MPNAKTKQEFSSLEVGYFVLEIVGIDVGRGRFQPWVCELFDSHCPNFLTLIYRAWIRRKRFQHELARLGAIHSMDGLFSVRTSYNGAQLMRGLNIRSTLGGPESGEWTFVGSNTIIENDSLELGFLSLIAEPDQSEVVLHLGEMYQTFLLFRNLAKADETLAEFSQLYNKSTDNHASSGVRPK